MKAVRKFLCVLLTIALLPLSAIPVFADGGIGVIKDAEGLNAIRNNPGGRYSLANDISLAGMEWTPIDAFNGTLDGCGHSVTGMTISSASSGCIGLFSALGENARISNLKLTDARINVSGSGFVTVSPLGSPYDCFGFDVLNRELQITNCRVTGGVTVNMTGGTLNAFALAGALSSTAEVTMELTGETVYANALYKCDGCESEGDITLYPGPSGSFSGCAVGMYACVNCANNGDLSADEKTDGNQAWVAGASEGSQNCVNTGKLSSYYQACAISSSSGCVNTGDVTAASIIGVCGGYDNLNEGALINHADAVNVSIMPVDDVKGKSGGNINGGKIEFAPGTAQSLTVTGKYEKDSLNKTDFVLDAKTCGVSIYQEGLSDKPGKTGGAITVTTTSGGISVSSTNMKNSFDITCSSQSGAVTAHGGDYNEGKISASSNSGKAEAYGANNHNKGEVYAKANTGSAYATGVTANGGYNEGTVYGESVSGNVNAHGAATGSKTRNDASVTAVSGSGECAAFGCYSSESINTGNILAKSTSGKKVSAGGVGYSSLNYGDVTAVCTSAPIDDSNTHAFGADDAASDSFGTVTATSNDFACAHAYSGHAEATGNYAKAYGATCRAHSSAFGVTAQNGEVYWVLNWHDKKDCSCDLVQGNAYLGTAAGPNYPRDSDHSWHMTILTEVTAKGSAPALPQVPDDWPEDENKDESGDVQMALFESYDDGVYSNPISSLKFTSRSFSFEKRETLPEKNSEGRENTQKTNYNKTHMRVRVNNGGADTQNFRVTLSAPDGFSFQDSSVVKTKIIGVTVPAGEYRDAHVTVCPVGTMAIPSSAAFSASGDLSGSLTLPVIRNENEGLLQMRPTVGVTNLAEMSQYADLQAGSEWRGVNLAASTSDFQQNLATVCAGLSGAAYRYEKVGSGLENLGFTQIRRCNYTTPAAQDQHPTDVNLVACAFGAQKALLDGELYTVVAVVVRGTVKEEWEGNLNWGSSDVHQSFLNAQKYVREQLNYYLDEADITGKVKLVITGHSRGAAVADILADRLMRSGDFKARDIFSYNFATPNSTTVKSDSASRSNVFNILFERDIICYVPDQYYRYGKDLYITQDIWNAKSVDFKREYAKLSGGYDYVYPDNLSLIALLQHSHIAANPNYLKRKDLTAFESYSEIFYKAWNRRYAPLPLNGLLVETDLFALFAESFFKDQAVKLYGVYTDMLPGIVRDYVLATGDDPMAIDIAKAHCMESYASWMKVVTRGDYRNNETLTSEMKQLEKTSLALRFITGKVQEIVDAKLIELGYKARGVVNVTAQAASRVCAAVAEYIAQAAKRALITILVAEINALRNNPIVRAVAFHCPVDIKAYDAQGNLIGQIINDDGVGTDLTAAAVSYTDGDDKGVFLPEGDYTAQIIARQDGKVKVEISEHGGENYDCSRVVSFGEVELKKGDIITLGVKGALSGSLDNYTLTMPDGEVVYPSNSPLSVSFTDAEGFAFDVNAFAGTAAFTGYTGSRTEIAIPRRVIYEQKAYDVVSVKDAAFSANAALAGVAILEGVGDISASAFAGAPVGLKVYAYAQTAAQTAAEGAGLSFEALLWGDADNDKTLGVRDCVSILIADMAFPGSVMADVNFDGAADAADARIILDALAEM